MLAPLSAEAGPSRTSSSSPRPSSDDGGRQEQQVQQLLLERRIKWQERRRHSNNNGSVDLTANGSSSPKRGFKSHPPSPDISRRSSLFGGGPHDDDDGDETQAFLPSAAASKLSRAAKIQVSRNRNRSILFVCFFICGAWLIFAFTRYALPTRLRSQQRLAPAASTSLSSSAVTYTSTYDEPAIVSGPHPAHSFNPPSDPLPFWYPPPAQRRKVEPIQAYEPLTSNSAALDDWIAHGRLSSTVRWPVDHPARKHDVLFSWVNGSDWEHARALDLYAEHSEGSIDEWWPRDKTSRPAPARLERRGDDNNNNKGHDTKLRTTKANHDAVLRDVGQNRFREIGELRYAVRSAVKNLRDLATVHILSPSFFPPTPYDLPGPQQVPRGAPADWQAPHQKHSTFLTEANRVQWGQLPDWLNVSHPQVHVGMDDLLHPSPDASTISKSLRIHHDWQLWTPNWLLPSSHITTSISGATLALWKQQHLPSFNSIAFESMLGSDSSPSMTSSLHETFIYANDDMFFVSPLTLSDFFTPLFGPVLRFDPRLLVHGRRNFDESSRGEWPSLSHAAWLLDRRFGKRARPYTVHDPRTMSVGLLREMRMLWAEEWRGTGEERFRSASFDRPGTSTHFMFAHFLVERYREALLWSYIVLRLDANDDGYIDVEEMGEMLRSLGLQAPISSFAEIVNGGPRYTAHVRMPYRSPHSTNSRDGHLSLLDSLQLPRPLKTTYRFLATDGGYPFMTLHPYVQSKAPPRPAGGGMASGISQVAEEPYPVYHAREGFTRESDARFSKVACRLELAGCLSKFGGVGKGERVEAQELFKEMAFEKGERCGDCLIVHLLGQSGERGLEAFLPPEGKKFSATAAAASSSDSQASPQQPQEPHLPLTPTYFPINTTTERLANPAYISSPYAIDHTPDFSSASISTSLSWSGNSQRSFSLSLLHRYVYAIGSSPSRFHRMEFEASTQAFLEDLSYELAGGEEVVDEGDVPAFVCLNDDYGAELRGRMRGLVGGWAGRWFAEGVGWEE